MPHRCRSRSALGYIDSATRRQSAPAAVGPPRCPRGKRRDSGGFSQKLSGSFSVCFCGSAWGRSPHGRVRSCSSTVLHRLRDLRGLLFRIRPHDLWEVRYAIQVLQNDPRSPHALQTCSAEIGGRWKIGSGVAVGGQSELICVSKCFF